MPSATAEIDHIFICVSAGANEAEALTTLGLTEGAPNTHPGQGTACRRFFFHNSYLEFLWVSDPAEAQSETIQRTQLWQRWAARDRGACPFGIGFRPGQQNGGGIPFPAWEYRPPYLPDSWAFHVGTNVEQLTEPMLFYLPFGQRPDAQPNGPWLEHAAGMQEMTHIELIIPHADRLSPALESVAKLGLVHVRKGKEYLVEIEFDRETQGRREDFRPRLPLLFRW